MQNSQPFIDNCLVGAGKWSLEYVVSSYGRHIGGNKRQDNYKAADNLVESNMLIFAMPKPIPMLILLSR